MPEWRLCGHTTTRTACTSIPSWWLGPRPEHGDILTVDAVCEATGERTAAKALMKAARLYPALLHERNVLQGRVRKYDGLRQGVLEWLAHDGATEQA